MNLRDGLAGALDAAIALAIGSFVATLALRLPAGGTLLGRSCCPHCSHRLGVRDLVPVASWVAQRGRCRYCGAAIGFYYPAVELAALAIALWAASVESGWQFWASCAFGWTLLALAITDFRDGVLPDVLTLALVPAGMAVAWLNKVPPLADSIAGAAAGFLLFAGIAWAYRRWRGRDGLGGGDAKLLAGIGAWVGGLALPTVVLLAALIALGGVLAAQPFRGRLSLSDRVPFGPALAAAGWIVWLYGTLA